MDSIRISNCQPQLKKYFRSLALTKSLILIDKPSTDLVAQVTRFAHGCEQQDDLSLMLLNCLPVVAPEKERQSYSPLPFNFSLRLNSKQIKNPIRCLR